jgi:hypothetical protein
VQLKYNDCKARKPRVSKSWVLLLLGGAICHF